MKLAVAAGCIYAVYGIARALIICIRGVGQTTLARMTLFRNQGLLRPDAGANADDEATAAVPPPLAPAERVAETPSSGTASPCPAGPTEASGDALGAGAARVPQVEPPPVSRAELHSPLQAFPTFRPEQANPKPKPCPLSRKIVVYKLPGRSAPARVQRTTARLSSGATYQGPEQRRSQPHRQPPPQAPSRAGRVTVAQHNVAPATEGDADAGTASNGGEMAAGQSGVAAEA